ncbi:hypothetical protein ACJX0J_025923 [Zea mays]
MHDKRKKIGIRKRTLALEKEGDKNKNQFLAVEESSRQQEIECDIREGIKGMIDPQYDELSKRHCILNREQTSHGTNKDRALVARRFHEDVQACCRSEKRYGGISLGIANVSHYILKSETMYIWHCAHLAA